MAVGVTISVVAILVIFYSNYNRIYKLLLEKDMEQIKFTLCYKAYTDRNRKSVIRAGSQLEDFFGP